MTKSVISLSFPWKVGKMCGRTCVGVTRVKKVRTHALRTHVLEAISHAHAHVRPHIARVRARTHLRNSYFGLYGRIEIEIMEWGI